MNVFCACRGIAICVLGMLAEEIIKGSASNFLEWVMDKLLTQWYGWIAMFWFLLCTTIIAADVVQRYFREQVKTFNLFHLIMAKDNLFILGLFEIRSVRLTV